MATTKQKSQSQKFKELARETECDPDEAAFEKKLKKIATPSNKAVESSKKKKRPD